MDKKALLIGRWQVPELHEGHKALINKVIERGYKPVVAIRDTKRSDKDPYTVQQRRKSIAAAFGHKVEIIVIPDISCVVHGRDIGYDVIQLSEDLEAISGTAIRHELKGKL